MTSREGIDVYKCFKSAIVSYREVTVEVLIQPLYVVLSL
jgi:hypothetical protein